MTINDIALSKYILSAALFVIGLLIAKKVSSHLENQALKHLSPHQSMLIRRLTHGIIFLLFLVSALGQLGFHFGVLLGAAGVFTVALSFASQTSIANLISGLFLLIERPFKVGDLIQVKSLTGKVHSIDLLSTKIISTDNKLVRLPNESLIKTEIINLNFYKFRRLDLLIGIDYNSDVPLAITTLKQIAEQQPNVVQNKPISADINQLLDAAIELKLSLWLPCADLRTAKTTIYQSIISEFKKLNIDIPYPHLTIINK